MSQHHQTQFQEHGLEERIATLLKPFGIGGAPASGLMRNEPSRSPQLRPEPTAHDQTKEGVR